MTSFYPLPETPNAPSVPSNEPIIINNIYETSIGLDGTTPTLVFSENGFRKYFVIRNNGTPNIYLGFTQSTSPTSHYRKILPGEVYRLDIVWHGQLWAAADDANGMIAAFELMPTLPVY